MRLVVFGGTGFIGSHVVDHLVAAGHEVRVVSRGLASTRPKDTRATYVQADYRRAEDLPRLLDGCDAVVHSISTTVPGTAEAQPQTDVTDNLVALLGLLQAMVATGVRRLVYLSSGGTVYGVPDSVPIPETHPRRPINSYGIVKAAAESYIDVFRRSHGLATVILRPSNPYGPGQGRDGTQGLVNTLLHRALNGTPVEVWGDGSVVRDYLHVHDLARFCGLAVESHVTGTFNAASGIGTSVNEMIAMVRQISGRQIRVTYKEARAVDAPVSVLDVTAAQQTFGWVPKIPLAQGLTQTWDWHVSTHGMK